MHRAEDIGHLPDLSTGNFPLDTSGNVPNYYGMEIGVGFRDRLREKMEEGKHGAAPLAKAAGLGESAIRDLFRRESSPSIDHAVAIARALGVSPEWLITGAGENGSARTVPVVSYIGAGAEIYAIDDHAKGDGIETIPAPPGSGPSAVGVIVRGDSMWPAYKEGDVLIYDHHSPVDDLIGKECVVELEDGRTLVKTIKRGAGDNFTLVSHNAPDIEDVCLRWAAKVGFVIKG